MFSTSNIPETTLKRHDSTAGDGNMQHTEGCTPFYQLFFEVHYFSSELIVII